MKCAGDWTLVVLVSMLSASGGCREAQQTQPARAGETEVTLALNWFADAQHGGFFAAQEHGLFAKAGLNVQIIPGGPAAPVVQNVALKRVTFGIANADQILMARGQQAPIVAVFAAMQNSPRCIMVHEQSGITEFEELRDLKLALGAGKAFARFLQMRCDFGSVQIVPYTGSIAPFLHDQRLAQQAYVFSEPFVARREGARPRCLMVSQLGFNPYTSCLITHEDFIRQQPDLVQRTVRAAQHGWQIYLRSPDAIHAAIQASNPQMDVESLRFASAAIRPLCLPDGLAEAKLGMMTKFRWQELGNQLVELGLLEPSVNPFDAFTMQFLDEPVDGNNDPSR
jgi:NitT/TauT family transport system substrate-binding protein